MTKDKLRHNHNTIRIFSIEMREEKKVLKMMSDGGYDEKNVKTQPQH